MKLPLHVVQAAMLGALLLSDAAMSATGSVYKCVDSAGRTAYQSDPCDASAAETRMNIAAATADAPLRSRPPAEPEAPSMQLENSSARPSASRRGPFPWGRRTLAVGMSDDEVLNLAGWGRPSSVTRARMPHAWHEDWIYRTAGATEERRLHFVNMRLVSVDVEPAGPPPIQMAGQ